MKFWNDLIENIDSTDDSGIRRICGKQHFQYAPCALNAMDRAMVLYLPFGCCHPAEGSKFYLGMDKTRPGKDGDILKIVIIIFNKSKGPGQPREHLNRNTERQPRCLQRGMRANQKQITNLSEEDSLQIAAGVFNYYCIPPVKKQDSRN